MNRVVPVIQIRVGMRFASSIFYRPKFPHQRKSFDSREPIPGLFIPSDRVAKSFRESFDASINTFEANNNTYYGSDIDLAYEKQE